MSENEEKSNNRFSKAILTRIVAVGLFVAIGTVAVVYLMSHGRNQSVETVGEQEFEGELAVAEQPIHEGSTDLDPSKGAIKASFTPVVDTNDRSLSNQPRSSGGAVPPSPPSSSGFSDSSFNSATDRFAAVPAMDRPLVPAGVDQGDFSPANPAKQAPPSLPRELSNDKPGEGSRNDGGFLPSLPTETRPAASRENPASTNSFGDSSEFPATAPPATNQNQNSSRGGDQGSGSRNSQQPWDQIDSAFGSSSRSPASSAPAPPLTTPDLPNRINPSPTDTDPRLQGPAPQKPLNDPITGRAVAEADKNFGTTSARSEETPPPRTASSEPAFSPFNPAGQPSDNSASSRESRSPAAGFEPLATPSTPPSLRAVPPTESTATDINTNSRSQPNETGGSSIPPRTSPQDRPEAGFNSAPPRSDLNSPSSDSAASGSPPASMAAAVGRDSGQSRNPNFQSDSVNRENLGTASPLPRSASFDSTRGGGNPPVARTANVPGERKLEGLQAPSLTIEKLSPREITVNEAASFVVLIRNVGRVDAMDVQVHDQVPANTEFINSNPPASMQADRKIVWDLGLVPAGKEVKIEYQLKPLAPGEIGSVAQVTFATQASMRTMVTQPELEMTLRSKPVVMIGGDVVLEAIITNRGNGAAKQVLVQKDVPPQLEFQQGYRELEYEVGTLLPGQSKRIQLVLKAAKTGRVKNVMVVTALGGQRVQQEFELEIVAPDIKVAADGPTRRFLNRQVTNVFTISNEGTAPATNVELVARLPRGLRFVSANNQGIYRPQNHAVVWSMAQLPTNVDAQVELVTMPVEVGEQDIQFQVAADLNLRNSVAHTIQVEHSVDIYFDIKDLVDPIEVGAETAYQIRLVNQGTIVATNVRLQAQFPAGLLPVSVEGNLPNQIAGQNVQFSPIASLKPGEEVQLRIRAKGNAPGDHRVVLTMQADGRDTVVTKEEATRVYADR